jgi:hypothetical protein
LNADSEDVNNWEVDMRLKTRYEHPRISAERCVNNC